MTFARPWLLLIGLLLPAWLWWRSRRRPTPVRIADGVVAQGAAGRRWMAAIPLGCRCLTLAALVLAVAGPRLPGDRTTIKRSNTAFGFPSKT